MIARRIAIAAAAIAVVSAASAVTIFAAAFALYALLRGPLTPSGAAGVLALASAVLAGAAAFVLTRVARFSFKSASRPKKSQADNAALLDRLLDLAQSRPIAAAGAAAAAGLLAFANPALVTAVLRAFTGSRTTRR